MTVLASPLKEGSRQSHIVIQERRIREPKASVIGIPKGFRNKRANLRSHRAGRCNPEPAGHVGYRRLRYGSCHGLLEAMTHFHNATTGRGVQGPARPGARRACRPALSLQPCPRL